MAIEYPNNLALNQFNLTPALLVPLIAQWLSADDAGLGGSSDAVMTLLIRERVTS
jgi:hypothetical protein